MTTTRHCLDAATIRHLQRDGIGWGHDLDCGCFDSVARRAPPGVLRGLLSRFGNGR
ncbi:hypothetical protein [Salibaculum griseiflavum]|uniref:hypothetical protein n=1 Tax=Salibaculum griseiflavum TaxID=1914409 RepID=UPI001C38E5E8|nr:hypothetical protein [Salibaculum griseiflavum]